MNEVPANCQWKYVWIKNNIFTVEDDVINKICIITEADFSLICPVIRRKSIFNLILYSSTQYSNYYNITRVNACFLLNHVDHISIVNAKLTLKVHTSKSILKVHTWVFNTQRFKLVLCEQY